MVSHIIAKFKLEIRCRFLTVMVTVWLCFHSILLFLSSQISYLAQYPAVAKATFCLPCCFSSHKYVPCLSLIFVSYFILSSCIQLSFWLPFFFVSASLQCAMLLPLPPLSCWAHQPMNQTDTLPWTPSLRIYVQLHPLPPSPLVVHMNMHTYRPHFFFLSFLLSFVHSCVPLLPYLLRGSQL